MKQGQYALPRSPKARLAHAGGMSEALCYPAFAPQAPVRAGAPAVRRSGSLIGSVFRLAWFLVTLPFRILFFLVGLVGRLFGVALGFTLMVVGMALWAGPFFLIGIPMFIIGLLLTLRSLG